MTLEKELALHCAPAFAGIKPSNLLSYNTKHKTEAKAELDRLNRQLNSSGIFFKILCEYENRLLILAYRKNKLSEYLDRAEINDFLKTKGYRAASGIDEKLALLAGHIEKYSEFPHEIGAFLGYPIDDIYGFIYHKNCKYTGHWKVYGNVEQAKKLFHKYDSCRDAVVSRMSMGKTLTDMFALRLNKI